MLADAQRNRYVHQQMNHSQTTNSAQACGAQVASEAPTQPQYQQIKLAMDVHAASIVVEIAFCAPACTQRYGAE
jgi:hypothetical protein